MQHRIPLYLEEPDKFLGPLTARQAIILLVGVAFGFALADNFNMTRPLGLVLGVLTFSLVSAGAVFCALGRLEGQDIEHWLSIRILYLLQPRYYLWSPNETEDLLEEDEHTKPEEEDKEEVYIW